MDKLEHETAGDVGHDGRSPDAQDYQTARRRAYRTRSVLPDDGTDPFATTRGRLAQPPSRAKGARCSSSSTTAKSRPPGANWPRTWWPTSISTARWARPNAKRASASWSTASAAPSPTGASQDGYFATPADGERFYRELAWLCLHQYASFNSPVWFNVGLYHQYGIKGAMCNWHWDKKAGDGHPAARTPTSIRRPRPASSRACRTTWKTSWSWPAARPCSSSSARARAPTSPRSARTARSFPAAGGRRARCRSCGFTIRSRPWSKAAARPAGPPRCSRSRTGIPT